MSVTEINRTAPTGSITAFRVVSLVERFVDGVTAWGRSRGTAHALAELSDKQLADIGLHRGDIADVAVSLARR